MSPITLPRPIHPLNTTPTPPLTPFDHSTITAFHRLQYLHAVHESVTWMGIPVVKTPQDLFLYQDLIYATRPNVIIETGTFLGGSALFFSHLQALNSIPYHTVITIDPNATKLQSEFHRLHPDTPRRATTSTHTLDMDATDPATLAFIQRTLPFSLHPDSRIMVVLDSQHERAHVLKELDLWAPLVTPGCYLVVEDTNINDHPIRSEDSLNAELAPIVADGGPLEAIDQWIGETADWGEKWKTDNDLPAKFLFSYNTWIQRK